MKLGGTSELITRRVLQWVQYTRSRQEKPCPRLPDKDCWLLALANFLSAADVPAEALMHDDSVSVLDMQAADKTQNFFELGVKPLRRAGVRTFLLTVASFLSDSKKGCVPFGVSPQTKRLPTFFSFGERLIVPEPGESP